MFLVDHTPSVSFIIYWVKLASPSTGICRCSLQFSPSSVMPAALSGFVLFFSLQ